MSKMGSDNDVIVTILIPSMNEEKNIKEVLQNASKALNKIKLKGEIVLMDSSTDKTPKIAKKLGAKVYTVEKKGLGQAYIESLSKVRGNYIIMGDADGTYDYKEIDKFVVKLKQGYEFVMGTRLKGWIEKNSMPKLHRYFGTPLTTWILNKLFKLNFSDINCGMRAITKKAFEKINLKSQSWEYASEMVIKAGLLKLRSTEVPIHFYKDKKGRKSHLRNNWFTPWYAGWINLKIMLLYAPNFVFFIPGLFSFSSGLVITIISTFGLISSFQYYYALLGSVLTMIGYLMIQLGILSKVFSDLNKYYDDVLTRFIKKKLNYSTGMITGFIIFMLGLMFNTILLIQWILNNFKLYRISIYGTTGLTLMMIGFQTITFTFIYEVFKLSKKKAIYKIL